MPCSMADFVEEITSPRVASSERYPRQTDLVEDAFISPRDAKRPGGAFRSSVAEHEWSLKESMSDSLDASMTPREMPDGASPYTMSPRSLMDVTSDTTRASTSQQYGYRPSEFKHLDYTSSLRTPRHYHRRLDIIAACNGLHGRDLRSADDTSPGPTAYDKPLPPGRSSSFGLAERRTASWALLKHVSSEYTRDPNSPGTDNSPRFHRPSLASYASQRGHMSRLRGEVVGDVLVHNLSPVSSVGPGTYDLDRTMSSSSPRISPSPRRCVSRIEKSPGPAEYQLSDTWEKDWRCTKGKFTTLSSRSRAQMEKSASCPRICRGGDIFLHVSEKEQTPGPGAYHHSYFEDPMAPRRAASSTDLQLDTHGLRRLGYLRETVSSRSKSVNRERSRGSSVGSPIKISAKRHYLEEDFVGEASPYKASPLRPIFKAAPDLVNVSAAPKDEPSKQSPLIVRL